MKYIPNNSRGTLWNMLSRLIHDLLSFFHDILGTRSPFFARMSFGIFCLFALCYVAFVVVRIIIVVRLYNSFGVNVILALPVDPTTASVISNIAATLSLLIFFSVETLFFIAVGKDKTYWRNLIIAVGTVAIAASYFMKKDVLADRCYTITPDRGIEISYANEHHQCGIDPTTALQTKPVTPDIVPSIRALKNGEMPHQVDSSTIDPNALFSPKDGHSLYWFHRNGTASYELFDSPGFHPGTQTPLGPVTQRNAAEIREFIQRQKDNKMQERRKAEATAEQARLEADRQQRAEALHDDLARAREMLAQGNRIGARDILSNYADSREAADMMASANLFEACAECGFLESVSMRRVEGQSGGAGAVGGAIAGGTAGHQAGQGHGRDIATGVGILAGAFIGNLIEKGLSSKTVYDLSFRMDDGSQRVMVSETKPEILPGQRVRVTIGTSGLMVHRI